MLQKLSLFSLILIIIGAINWGIIGLFGFDFLGMFFGYFYVDRLVYILVGAAGVYQAFVLFKKKK